MFASVAHAMGTAGAGQAGGADALMQFVPLIAMLAIFYFLLIRPQQKRAKQHKAMLEALKKGDQVLTTRRPRGPCRGSSTATSSPLISAAPR